MQPYLYYCSPLWDNCGKLLKDKTQQFRSRVITGATYAIRSAVVVETLLWEEILYKVATFDKKVLISKDLVSKSLSSLQRRRRRKNWDLGVRDGLLGVVRVGGVKQKITVWIGRLIKRRKRITCFWFFIYFLFLSDEGPMLGNARLYYPYWRYTDLFIFRFVSLLCLRSTLRLYKDGLYV